MASFAVQARNRIGLPRSYLRKQAHVPGVRELYRRPAQTGGDDGQFPDQHPCGQEGDTIFRTSGTNAEHLGI
jgi:hypothetical protein